MGDKMDLGKYDMNTHKKVLKFWENNNIYEKSKNIFKLSNNKKPFYFLQGPPYTNGKFHMGHAWNNSLKDSILRFKRMNGFEVWDRAGYDMHGLPTAKKVQKLKGLKTKQDIIKFGVDKFIQECINTSQHYSEIMTQDLKSLGVWMNYKDAYKPITQDYIDGIWFLVKKAHEKNRLYEDLRTITWCPDCATALAKHEQEYKELKDTTIYVKFKSVSEQDTYFIIWTTTPWTITFNLAIMVNPDFEYSKIKVTINNKTEYWIIAKELVDSLMQKLDINYDIVETFLGKTLDNQKYEHFWQNIVPEFKELKKYNRLHTIVLSKEYVTLDSGTGLVHCAPGCGPEDYEVGRRNGLPAFNTIDEYGKFPTNYGVFANKLAKKDDPFFISEMEKLGVVIAKQNIVHDYATCERCHTPVVFRTTKQWFFKIEDIKEKMIEFNKAINWVPQTGKNAFHSWLDNLRDNSITKQRFWGTPIPIWRCDKCSKIEVIGSKKELETKVETLPKNLHKPWIDNITWKCSCGGTMKRIPDVLDVWIDSGTASWNSLYYPQTTEYFDKFFPADFILEAKEQVRGWFNLLMISSIIALNKNPFKAAYMHGMLTDVDGVKMSKSLGNVIAPSALTDKYGVDTLRFYITRTKAGQDINFSWAESELAYKNLMILWNIHKLLINFTTENKLVPKLLNDNINLNELSISDKYILSKTHSTLKQVTEKFNSYNLDAIPKLVESLFLEISRIYIQLNRDIMSDGTNYEKQRVADILFSSLYSTIKMSAPVIPFITEQIYQNFREAGFVNKESVHLEFWDSYNQNLINEVLESNFKLALNIIEAGLKLRDKIQYGVRWPLQELRINTENKELIKQFESIIMSQLNVKKITIGNIDYKHKIKINYRAFGERFGTDTGTVLTAIKNRLDEIESAFDLNKDFALNINEKPVILDKSLFEITKESKDYEITTTKLGEIYLKKEITSELFKEGFTREIIRRVQTLRKKAGLSKTDRIILYIDLDDPDLIYAQEKLVKKVGADKLVLIKKQTNNYIEDKIKNKRVFIAIEQTK